MNTRPAPILFLLLALLPAAELRGQANDNPTGPSGVFNGNVTTGCSYDPYTGNAMRQITDIVVNASVGAYPLAFTRTANSRLTVGNTRFGYAGKWRHNYDWGIAPSEDHTTTSFYPVSYNVGFPDGRNIVFLNGPSSPLKGPIGTGELVTKLDLTTLLCYLNLSDGGKVEFKATLVDDGPDGNGHELYYYSYQAQAIIDPHSLRYSFSYNTDGTLSQVTDFSGRYLHLYYSNTAWHDWDGSTLVLDHVTSSDGRPVQYYYMQNNFDGTTYTQLDHVAYYNDGSIGTAYYTYVTSNVPGPGGHYNGVPLLATCDDSMYAGPMKKIAYEYAPNATGVVAGQILHEKNLATGTVVSTLSWPSSIQRVETRGDGPTRTFNYGAYLGNTSTYLTYLLKSYTDFLGHTTTLSYDVNGFVCAVQDANLNTTSYTRLALTGAISTITHPGDNSHIDYTYEDATTGYYLKTVTNELGTGHTTTYLHSNTTTMNVSEIDYPDGGIEKFPLYNIYNQVLSHTMVSNTASGSTGGIETFTYDTGGRGLLMKYTPPTGTNGATNYTYDVNDRLSTIKDGRGNITTLYHNARGQLTIIQHPDTDQSLVGYAYNPDGTLQLQNVQLNATDFAETDYTYDDYKRLTTVTTPQRFSGDTTPRTTSFFYADNGGIFTDYTHTDANVTETVSPSGQINQTIYDANKRKDHTNVGVATTDAATTYFDYDNVGNLADVIDPLSHQTNYFYDVRNRLIGVDDPIATDRNSATPPHTVSYTYDFAGNKKSEQRANDQMITYDTYDVMNRLTQMTVHQAPTADAISHYTWTRAGKVDLFTDPRGKVYNYDYDTLNRLKTTTYPTGGGTEQTNYDLAGNLQTFTNRAGNIETFTYDTRNRETNYSWSNGNPQPRTLVYDDASRITACNTTNTFINFVYYDDSTLKWQEEWGTGSYGDGAHRTITYAYNAEGLRAAVTYPGVPKFTYDYTGRNQLQDMITTYDNSHLVDYTYDKDGFMTNRSLPNGTSSTYAPDALDRVTNITYNFSSSTGTLGYGYDKVSNRSYANRDDGTADGFTYDANNQMLSFRRDGTLSGGTVSGGTQTSYTFDASGNRLTAGGTTYGPANNLNEYTTIGGLNVTNASNGNISGYDSWVYGYDAMNRLTSASKGATSATFYYDGLNRQVARVENGATTTYSVWDGWNLYAEYDASGTQTNRWTYGGNDLVRRLGTQYGTLYFSPDASGSTRYVTNSAGNIVERYTYDAYGAPTFYDANNVKRNPNVTAYGINDLFTGQRWYPALGLYDLRHRAYRADIGRFLQPDPIGFGGDSANIYRYVGNNPANRSDPMGMGEPQPLPPLQPKTDYTIPVDITVGRIIVTPEDYPFRDPSHYDATLGGFQRDPSVGFRGNGSSSPSGGGTINGGGFDIGAQLLTRFAPSKQAAADMVKLANGFDNYAKGVSVVVALPVVVPLAADAAEAAAPFVSQAARGAYQAALGYAVTHPEETQEFVTQALNVPDGTWSAPTSYVGLSGFLLHYITGVGFPDPGG